MTLFETHRPRALSEIVGQSPVVSAVQSLVSRPSFAGDNLMLLGDPGTGKTSIALALCRQFGIHEMDITHCGGDEFTIDALNEAKRNFGLSTWGESGFKALVVDEFHRLSDQCRAGMLPWLEHLAAGRNRLVILTSSEIPVDMYGTPQGKWSALASRCKVFVLELERVAGAKHLASIAEREGKNGQPLGAYVELLDNCGGNMRAALQKIECGEMLKPWTPRETPAAASVKEFLGKIPATVQKMREAAPAPVVNGAEVQELLEYLKKLCPGSKKYVRTVAELSAHGVKV